MGSFYIFFKMQNTNSLLSKITCFSNLVNAYNKAAKGKRERGYVKEFYLQLEQNLFSIKNDIEQGCYNWQTYTTFEVNDSKKRIIHAPKFRDRVTQHAINNILEPLFDKQFIFHSYACRRGKGTHKGVKAYKSFIKKDKSLQYALKCDIKSYFQSISHDVVMQLIGNQIRDQKLLNLLDCLLKKYNPNHVGIAIGSLISQLIANIVLNQLDNFCKTNLKAKYYLRYMDDFILLNSNINVLRDWRIKIAQFLKEKLFLTLHPNKQHIIPIKNGIKWLGYRVYHTHTRISGHNVLKFISRLKLNNNLKRLYEIHNTWFAIIKHANTYKLHLKIRKWYLHNNQNRDTHVLFLWIKPAIYN